MHLEEHRLTREELEAPMRAEAEEFACTCGRMLVVHLAPGEPKMVQCPKCKKVYEVRVENAA